MNRRTLEIVQGNGDVLHKTIIESDLCDQYSDKSEYIQNELFRLLSITPGLYVCGDTNFENMAMRHDGQKWVITFSAIKKRPET